MNKQANAGTAAIPVDYEMLRAQAREIMEQEPWYVAAMSNLSALIFEILPELNWAGFYLMRNGVLTVGPFQGKPACIHIPVGRGVCGTAAALGKTQLVPDVHAFPGHIACDSASASELVIPVFAGEKVAAVLDLDSPQAARFSPEDASGLEALVREMERALDLRALA